MSMLFRLPCLLRSSTSLRLGVGFLCIAAAAYGEPTVFWASDPVQPDDTVLITAGASAPETVVDQCVEFLTERLGATVESRAIRKEEVYFPLPKEFRRTAGARP